jgi:hypothetical protein
VLTAQLKSRLEELRRETGDNYHYTQSLDVSGGPIRTARAPQPWRPNRS